MSQVGKKEGACKMLDAFIIDELRRREEAERHEDLRPRLEVPVGRFEEEKPFSYGEPEDDNDGVPRERGERGVVVIDL